MITRRTRRRSAILSPHPSRTASYRISLPPSLAAGPHARYQPRVVRSPAVHAPGVRSARACHMPAARPGSLPHGQLSAPCGLRIRAYGSPLARSASGRVLSPHYAAIWPDERLSGARVRHASRPGSGAHPTRGRPVCCRHALVRARTVHRPAWAAKHSSQHSSGLPPHAIRQRHPTAPPATGTRQSSPEAASEPQQASPQPNLTCSIGKR